MAKTGIIYQIFHASEKLKMAKHFGSMKAQMTLIVIMIIIQVHMYGTTYQGMVG